MSVAIPVPKGLGTVHRITVGTGPRCALCSHSPEPDSAGLGCPGQHHPTAAELLRPRPSSAVGRRPAAQLPFRTHPGEPLVHNRHHEHTNRQETPIGPDNSPASCTGSNAPGVPAPGVAGSVRRQGAPDRQAATEGGPQPGGDRQAESLSKRRQRTRQPKKRKRLKQPSCRMNAAEFKRFTDAAAYCEMSNAAFLAYAVDKATRDLSRTAAEIATEREVIEELFAARRHLGRIHGLFNQVAKALNSGADAPHLDAAAEAARTAARRMEDAADALLARYDGGAAE